jgi:ribose transport system substrate-binding protein
VRVLATQYTYFDVNRTAQIASALMLAHSDLRLIIASTGPEGQGVAAAVKQAGKQGRVKVLAFDAVPAEVQAVRDGAIQGLIAQAPERIGAEQVSELVRYLRSHPRGGPVTSRPARTLPLRLITADNVDDPALWPWIYTTSCETR